MLYFQRSFAALAAVFILLFSAFILPETVSARAKKCPERIPDSLLTLYLKSDLVVVASLKNEKFLKTTEEYDYGSYYDVEKILDVDKTFKGQKSDMAAYKTSEYKPKNSDASEEVSEENEYSLKVGDKALFFLVKNVESGYYELADYSSAMKRLSDSDLSFYEKRIKELKSILGKKKDQHTRLAEWLVRLIEEPTTREEGVRDLLASFTLSDYEMDYVEEVTNVKENSEENAEKNAEQSADKKPVAIDKDFRTANAPEIAAALTDSQKARISNELFASLRNDLARIDSAGNEEYISSDYDLISLVSRWDKQNFAMNLFANLQGTDGVNLRKISYLMNAVAYFLEDENLYRISSEYEYAITQDENEKTEYSESDVVITDSENEAAVSEPGTISEMSLNTEPETSVEIQKSDEVVGTEMPAPIEITETEKEKEKLTYKQYRAKLFENFTTQYGKIISKLIVAK
jgi:hypothetical protein